MERLKHIEDKADAIKADVSSILRLSEEHRNELRRTRDRQGLMMTEARRVKDKRDSKLDTIDEDEEKNGHK